MPKNDTLVDQYIRCQSIKHRANAMEQMFHELIATENTLKQGDMLFRLEFLRSQYHALQIALEAAIYSIDQTERRFIEASRERDCAETVGEEKVSSEQNRL